MAAFPNIFADRPILRRCLYGLGCLFIALLILLILIRILLATPPGRNFVEAQIEGMTISGQTIEIAELKGDLLGRFSIDQLRVADKDGTWLQARELQLDWSPWSLLGRHLDLDLISADRIRVERQPVLPEPVPSSETSGGSPIKRYSLEQLEIDEISISDAIIGREEVFALTADLDTRISDGRVNLELLPGQDTGDRIEAGFKWSEAEGAEGDLMAEGPSDGLLAELLMLAEPGPVDLEASVGGGATDWAGALDLRVSGEAVFGFEWANEEGLGEGQVIAGAFAPVAPYSDRLGGPVQLALWRPDEGGISVRLAAPHLILEGTGDESRSGGYAFSVNLTSDQVTRLLDTPDLAADRLRLSGTGGFNDGRLAFDSRLSLGGLSYADYGVREIKVQSDLRTDLNAEKSDIEFSLTSEGVTGLPGAAGSVVGTSPEIRGKVSLAHDGFSIDVPDLAIDFEQAGLTAAGRFDGVTSSIQFAGDASLNSDEAGISFANTSWSIAGDLADLGVSLDSDMMLLVGDSSLEQWLGKPLSVSARGRFADTGSVRLETLTAVNRSIDLTASGALESGEVSAVAAVNLAGGPIGTTTMSAVQANAVVSGKLDAPRFEVTLNTDQIESAGEVLRAVSMKVRGDLAGDRLSVNHEASLGWRAEALELSHDAVLQGDSWSIANLTATYAGLVLDGDVAGVGGDLETLAGSMSLNGALPFEDVGGSIASLVTFSGPAPTLDISVQDLVVGEAEISQLKIDGTYQENKAALDIGLSGTAPFSGVSQPFDLRSDVSADLSSSGLLIGLDGSFAELPVSTATPIKIGFAGGALDVEGALNLLGGRLAGTGRRDQNALGLSVIGDGLDLSYATQFADIPEFEGLLGLELDIANQGDRIVGHGQVSLNDLRRAGRPPETFTALLDLALLDERLSLDTRLNAPDGNELLLASTSLPVSTNATALSFAPVDTDTISASLKGAGALDTLWQLVGIEEIAIGGAYTIDASVALSDGAIVPNGMVSLSGANIEDQIAGVRLTDINLATLIDPAGVEVQSLTANGAKGGSLNGSGRYDFDGGAGVEIILDQLNALQRSDVEAILSGALNVTRGERITQIGGDLVFNRIDVDITKLPTGGYTTLDVQFADDPSTTVQPAEPSPIELDLDVSAPRRVFINGGGLQTEWAFDVEVSGNASDPKIFGDAEIVRGDVDLIGRNFQFDDSTIIFNGGVEDTLLNIRASREVDDFTAAIQIEGTALEPDIGLTSVPQLPEDEVISRVLFGRSPTELSAFEAAQLALAVASLARGGGFDMIGSAADTLGVDRLDFGLSDSGVPSIGAGKYLTPDLYLEVRSTPRGNAGTNLEWTPLRSLQVSTEIEANEAPRFGIQWKRDFEFGRKDKDADEAEKAKTDENPE